MNKESLLRGINRFGVLFAVAALGTDWLRTPGIGPKGSALAVIGLMIAFVPLFQSRRFENWRLKPGIVLGVLLVIAAALNTYLMIRNPNIGGDALWFHSSFHNLIAGKGWGNMYLPSLIVEPGYGMLSYPFYLLFDNIELSGMLVSAISYLLIIPAAFYATRFLFGLRSALFASALIAFWPALISFSFVSLSDVAFTFFLLVSFNFYVRTLLGRNSLFQSVLLGLSLGMAYLLRESEGLMVAGLVILTLFAMAIVEMFNRERKYPLESRFTPWLTAFASSLVFSLAVIFYSTLIHSATGYWTISTRLVPEYATIPSGPAATEVDQDSLIESTSIPSVTQVATINDKDNPISTEVSQGEPAATAIPKTRLTQIKIQGRGVNLDWVLLQHNLVDLVVNKSKMIAHALLPFTMIGSVFVLLPTRKTINAWKINPRRARMILAFSIYLSPLIPLLFLQGDRGLRYFLSDFVYFLILIAFLMVRLLEIVLESIGRKYFDLGLVLLCLVTLISALGIGSPTLSEVFTSQHAHAGLRAAGLWFHDNLSHPSDLTIFAPRKGHIALFYAAGQEFIAERAFDLDPNFSLDSIRSRMDSGVDYLLLDNHHVGAHPNLLTLWNDPGQAQEYGFSLLYRDNEDLFQVYVVGE